MGNAGDIGVTELSDDASLRYDSINYHPYQIKIPAYDQTKLILRRNDVVYGQISKHAKTVVASPTPNKSYKEMTINEKVKYGHINHS